MRVTPIPAWITTLVFILPLWLLISGCRSQAERQATASDTYHTCPMHPQIIQNKPGICPLCNMDLVPVEEDEEYGDHIEQDHTSSNDNDNGHVHEKRGAPEIRLDGAVIRSLGVRSEPVLHRTIARTLRLDGRVTPAEARIHSVTSRVHGFVEVLRIAETGQSVRQGDVLLEFYSPDAVTTQERLLQILDRGRTGEETVERVRQRLLNWGVPASHMEIVEKTGQVNRLFPMISPITGVVLRKSILQGQAAMAGTELYQIADLSEVWISARVWQSDLAWVRVGLPVNIRFRNIPGHTFTSTVFFVSPTLDPAARTAEIRIKLHNTPALDLRPEMLAEVVLREPDGNSPVPAVPAQSLIRAGGRDVAVVSLGGGRYQPREVVIGREAEGWIEILEGLEEGEEVVTSAQFLIDSESNLRAAVARLRASSASGSLSHENGHAH